MSFEHELLRLLRNPTPELLELLESAVQKAHEYAASQVHRAIQEKAAAAD